MVEKEKWGKGGKWEDMIWRRFMDQYLKMRQTKRPLATPVTHARVTLPPSP